MDKPYDQDAELSHLIENCVHCGGPIKPDQPKVYANYESGIGEHPAHMYLPACIRSLRERIEAKEGG